ncbi:MarR family winged helix-turn-helix transcriptional regulator [Streptococcus tangpeifui]|uniref:MarR family winged helix-turn-helix transcriptional regulator n=1 Tax=Streptococcus tangpeifui TaxID=2709400 RepID=UPI001F14EF2F|nr:MULTISPECIES: MarR family transcriptional regulator [unclassified Streptococcus]
MTTNIQSKADELVGAKESSLLLGNNLCFSLYVTSREFINRYTPLLAEIGLTYTQYVVMMVLWEEQEVITRDLRDRVFLDSGTLTPVLKKLEDKGFITKARSKTDARDLVVTITEEGQALKTAALAIQAEIAKGFKGMGEVDGLMQSLQEMMDFFQQERKRK